MRGARSSASPEASDRSAIAGETALLAAFLCLCGFFAGAGVPRLPAGGLTEG
ncbi:MAG TPA: hypothetical protein VHZ54_00590 [Solirubrobacterales bacterium]|nr:hypothetical protein [Solirubrobacterales bacterium]